MAGYTNLPTSESGSLRTYHTFGAEPLAPSSRDNGRATGSARPQKPPRPDILKLLDNKDHNWSGIVRDYDDCQELTRQYMSLHDRTGETDVAESTDFPEDRKAQKELARQLFEAILDVDPADAEHVHYRPISELSNIEVELLSWELLFAIRRAQDGIVGWAKWSTKSSRKYQKCRNFRERFELVKEGCRESKSVVHSMLVAPFIGRLTAAPSHECRLKTANKRINERKGAQLKGYRDIMAEKKPKSDADPPVPSNRKRKNREEHEQHQIKPTTANHKRRKIGIPKRLAAATVTPPAVSRGAFSSIPSDAAALSEAEPKKRPSVSRNSCAPNIAGGLITDPDRPFVPFAHQMPISGAADGEHPGPVAQLHPVVWHYPPTACPPPPPVWRPMESCTSLYPVEILEALGAETETYTATSNPEIPAALGGGTEASTVVSNPVDFDQMGEWFDFAAYD